ncbi:MAG: vWA domain-containing protein [Polyangiales bacterium]
MMLSKTRRPAPLLAALAALSLAGCGAKTGLLVPDVLSFPDADVPDVEDVMDVPEAEVPRCRPGTFPLTERAADILLVLDRSGSMNQTLNNAGGVSKWRLLRDALAATLPRVASRVRVGALFFPEYGAASRGAACALANIPSIDVGLASGTTGQILSVFDDTGTAGGTPTAPALLRAYTYLVRNPDRTRARYLVLATDGAPNCNAALDPATCICGGPGGGGRGCGTDAERCLDDTRAVSDITQIASNAVTSMPVYVIGLADNTDSTFATTLRRMAVAGGRPNRATGTPTYYDVQRPEELTAALSAIQNEVARCTFVAPSRPTDPDAITLTVNGVSVPRDTSRVNGWDWTDMGFGELTLFGAACPRDTETNTATATVGCGDE